MNTSFLQMDKTTLHVLEELRRQSLRVNLKSVPIQNIRGEQNKVTDNLHVPHNYCRYIGRKLRRKN